MEALISALAGTDVPATVVLVVSNRSDAGGLAIAEAAGVPTAVVSHRGVSREDFEAKVEGHLRHAGADLICLAGFMRVLSPDFSNRWAGRILNIHPSLLPSFRGLHVHEQVLAAGVAVSGCTVHWVTAELDGGPIVGQAVVQVRRDDTPQTLAKRVQMAEHALYPAAVRQVLGVEPAINASDNMLVVLK